jgi:hypothetical protein
MPKYGWQLNLQFPNNTGRNFPFAIFIGKKYNPDFYSKPPKKEQQTLATQELAAFRIYHKDVGEKLIF